MSESLKLSLACCLFSAIIGAYTVVLVNKDREQDAGCTVTYSRGNEIHVLVGKRDL